VPRLRGHRRLRATELVVTAKGGTPLAELEAELSAQRQMLAFEPRISARCQRRRHAAAACRAAPRAAGAVRDFVLGVTMMDARGTVKRFGGT